MSIHQKKVMIIFSCILLSLLFCPNSLVASVGLMGVVSVVTTLAVMIALVKKEYRVVIVRCTIWEKYLLIAVALFSVWYILVYPRQ
jgi:hypothetical protein